MKHLQAVFVAALVVVSWTASPNRESLFHKRQPLGKPLVEKIGVAQERRRLGEQDREFCAPAHEQCPFEESNRPVEVALG
jgi:hypothetical protein